MRIATIAPLIMIFLATAALADDGVCPLPRRTVSPTAAIAGAPSLAANPASSANYSGTLRVYVVEPISRWQDSRQRNYEFGYLASAVDSAVSIPYEGTIQVSKTWNGNTVGFGDVSPGNIMVIASMFSATQHNDCSSPQPVAPQFVSENVDAVAAAYPGETGTNVVMPGYTHTVLIEEGTTTWGPYCPDARSSLHSVFASGAYNFYYAAFVVDVNSLADAQMNRYNMQYVPTCYFDGGYTSDPGTSTGDVASRIALAGGRTVAPLDLEVTLTWLGSASLQVDVTVTNHHFVNSAPNPLATPDGPDGGIPNTEYAFSVTPDDPDNDPTYYMWDWGDGQTSAWLGPVPHGQSPSGSHSWTRIGTFEIKAKAKDTCGAETAWSPIRSIILGRPGDANGDVTVNVGDAVFIINYIFKSGATPVPMAAADSNCDQTINVGDAVFIINYVFKGGAEPGCN